MSEEYENIPLIRGFAQLQNIARMAGVADAGLWELVPPVRDQPRPRQAKRRLIGLPSHPTSDHWRIVTPSETISLGTTRPSALAAMRATAALLRRTPGWAVSHRRNIHGGTDAQSRAALLALLAVHPQQIGDGHGQQAG